MPLRICKGCNRRDMVRWNGKTTPKSPYCYDCQKRHSNKRAKVSKKRVSKPGPTGGQAFKRICEDCDKRFTPPGRRNRFCDPCRKKRHSAVVEKRRIEWSVQNNEEKMLVLPIRRKKPKNERR